MRKLLITLFFMLILSFGVFGYTQSTDDVEEIVDHDGNSTIIN